MTLQEIGARFNLSRERVRQLEAQALQRLRIGHRLVQRLGLGPALVVMTTLKGKNVKRYREAPRAFEGGTAA